MEPVLAQPLGGLQRRTRVLLWRGVLAGGMHAARLSLLERKAELVGRGVVDCAPLRRRLLRRAGRGRSFRLHGPCGAGMRCICRSSARRSRCWRQGRHWRLPGWQSRLEADARITVRSEVRLVQILGSDRVDAVRIATPAGEEQNRDQRGAGAQRAGAEHARAGGRRRSCQSRVLVNAFNETNAEYVLACGDIRAGGRQRVAAAVDDGANAAARAIEILAVLATHES